MATIETHPPTTGTLADLVQRLGDVPLNRIRLRPPPGTATIPDLIDVEQQEGRLCELVAGVLVEKPVGYSKSLLAALIVEMLNAFIRPRNLGHVTGEAGALELMPDLVRIPDVAYISWSNLPGGERPKERVPRVVPNIAIEILSDGNTPKEMSEKRRESFEAGVDLVWEIDPQHRRATAYRSLTDSQTLTEHDRLKGEPILPGFELPLADVFAELDRRR
ncbi:MAG TPA: Uma2 family endonuclease [Pirellulales bacterium]|jgi:Uma2 family endonuclease|nr:Uma2 family endonuclease [Pirellulales bacterium]